MSREIGREIGVALGFIVPPHTSVTRSVPLGLNDPEVRTPATDLPHEPETEIV